MNIVNYKLMGILNVTPDSFSDGGRFLDFNAAILQAEELIRDGADIIDIGGLATGPNSSLCGEEEELARIIELVALLSSKITVSVDTYRPKVAEACLKKGARIINDISALRYSSSMAELIKEYNAEVVIMYSKEEPHSPAVSNKDKNYEDIIETISNFFSERIEFAHKAGIKKEQIILDPGMGKFISHDDKYSWEVIGRLSELKEMFQEFKILIGVSRKGFLGGDLANRDPISQFVSTIALKNGVDIIRTHNPKMAREFIVAANKLDLI